jgi:hypothetical protein
MPPRPESTWPASMSPLPMPAEFSVKPFGPRRSTWNASKQHAFSSHSAVRANRISCIPCALLPRSPSAQSCPLADL